MLDKPLETLDAWVAYFTGAELPVLRRTVRRFAEYRENEDRVGGRAVAGTVLQDPTMALKVLAFIEAHRGSKQNRDITTIERAVMMIGITPFFRAFEQLVTLEEHLAAHPRALVGVIKVIARAHRSAQFAREWAIQRHDVDVDEVTVAALLHDIAEILVWSFAPELALRVRQMLDQNPGLRSRTAQQQVLGITYHDLQLALVRTWHLPRLLVTLMDDAKADHPRVRNVVLAVDLARHSAQGWDDAALPDDYKAICELLHVRQEDLLHRLGVPPEHHPLPPGQEQQ